jgi:cyclophilin family peptidyl-prolyl cis-trans isomerase
LVNFPKEEVMTRFVATLLMLAAITLMAGLASCETPAEADKEPAAKSETQAKETANPMVVLKTNHGNIKIELYQKEAPISVENFLSYVKDGFYDGTIVHRVIPGFVIQAGGFTEDMDQKKQKAPIKNEAHNGLLNKRGTLSMARTSAINSGTSHFFINLRDNTNLDHKGTAPATYGYAVFGKVVEGMDVVDGIAKVKTRKVSAYEDVPAEPVIIEEATLAAIAKMKTDKDAKDIKKSESDTKELKRESKKMKDE